MRIQTGILAALALSVAAACSEDSDKTSDGENTGGVGDQLFALTSNVWDDSGATGYLYTVSSLEEGEVDLDDAREFPGGAWLTGRDNDPHVYISSGEGGPTITRFDIDEEGALEEGPTISFERLGLTSGMRFGTAPIVSETKAYLVDPAQYRVATWNPKEMTVGELIELPIEAHDGVDPWIATVTVRGDRLLLTAVWESDYRFPRSSSVIAIDTKTDEVVETTDSDCEQLGIASQASDGTTYYSPYGHSSAARAVLGDNYGSGACALRVLPKGSRTDEKWSFDLSALADGRPAGELVLASDEVAFFRVYYADEIGVEAETWKDHAGTPAYRWWRWEIGEDSAEELPDQDLTVEAAHYRVGGKTYVGNPSADWSETTIVELDPEGSMHEGLKVTGTPGGVRRVR